MKAILDKILAIVLLKSTTANITALAAIIITAAKNLWGVDIPTEVIVGIFTALAFILRMVTKDSLESKIGN